MLRTRTDVSSWLSESRRRLALVSDTAAVEAQALLAHVTGRERSWLLAHAEHELAEGQVREANEGLSRLLRGEPLAYITGRREFFGMEFAVTPDVLIPRPETELLVETALAWLGEHPGRRAADIGTGSGIIAVSLARHCPDITLTGTDIRLAALRVARQNAIALGTAERIHWLQSDLLSGVSGKFDLVCANLPYIPTTTLRGLDVARYEPHSALDGGGDGLELVGRLLLDSPRWLAPGGCLLLEIEYRQGKSAAWLAQTVWPDAKIRVETDLAGLDRLLMVSIGE